MRLRFGYQGQVSEGGGALGRYLYNREKWERKKALRLGVEHAQGKG